MKKTLYLLLIIVMLFSSVACQKDVPVEYIIYYSSVDGIDDSIVEQDLSAKAAEMEFKNINKLDWYNEGQEIVDTTSKEQFEIVINNKTICGQLVRTKKLEIADSDDERTRAFGINCSYINYVEGRPRENFVIRRDTGELISYTDIFSANVTGDCNADKAKEIADKLVSDLYEKKYTDEYSYEKTELETGTIQYPQNYYTVKYTRYLHGYEIDAIYVQVNRVGQIVGIYATNIGKCYKIEERISKKAIEQAHNKLMALMEIKDSKLTSDTIVLQIAGDGKLYMQSLLKPQKLSTFFTINVE